MSNNIEIDFQATNRCNMTCSHCSMASGDQLSGELSRNKITQLLLLLSENKTRKILSISGGEPLLREDIFQIIDLAQDNGFFVRLQTNAILADRAILYKLRDKDVQIGLSIDGVDPLCSYRTPYTAHQKVIDVLDQCLSIGMRVKINTVVSKRNVQQIPRLSEYVCRKGVDAHSINFFTPMGRGTQYHMSVVDCYAWRKMIDGVETILQNVTTLKTNVMVGRLYYPLDNPGPYKCKGTLSDHVFVTAEGSVYPCVLLRWSGAGKRIESVKNGAGIVKCASIEFKSTKCMNAESYKICNGGGCPAYGRVIRDAQHMKVCDVRCDGLERGYAPGCTRSFLHYDENARTFN